MGWKFIVFEVKMQILCILFKYDKETLTSLYINVLQFKSSKFFSV